VLSFQLKGYAFLAWLNSSKLSSFTVSEAVIDPSIGGLFSAWEG
jgi:hypothetical protein